MAAMSMINPQVSNVDSTLISLGVFASDVQFRGSVAFVAQKGYSNKTVFSKGLYVSCSVAANMTVAVFGEFRLLYEQDMS